VGTEPQRHQTNEGRCNGDGAVGNAKLPYIHRFVSQSFSSARQLSVAPKPFQFAGLSVSCRPIAINLRHRNKQVFSL
jgi:hypothetical protein